MDLEGTSCLSPCFRFGLLPLVYAYAQAEKMSADPSIGPGAAAWLNELIWREFYVHILAAFPGVLRAAFKLSLRTLPWRDSPSDLRAWQSGLTGYLLVDAAMHQLAQTGWIHNRARMLTASFLTKDLLLNWQAGEAWFMHSLLDVDPAANNSGWQWSAGTGTDAAPYFRIFNPVLQGRKFDPAGDYVRAWLPELRAVPATYIHEPWRMPLDIEEHCAVRIGREYPLPIVDHAAARKRTLAAYKKAA